MNKKLPKRQGPWAEVFSRFLRNKMAVFGMIVILLLILCAIFAPIIAPYGIDEQDISIKLQSPSPDHLFGTDKFGRDIFSRVIFGSRISLQVGLIAVAVALFAGGTLGALAAFYGGRIDSVIMRFMDILMAVPGMLLAIAIAASLGPGLRNMMIAIGIGNVPGYARIVRASMLTVKESEFVEAATSIGASNFRIITKHILPNAMAPIIVQATLGVASSILACAMLSFLGLGIQPPIPEWGSMLSGARDFLRTHPYMATFPGIFIMMTVYALNVVGDGIRDAIDPRLKD
ncbi:ABC transporter permease [Anaeropeptidivorans aminofermentans]|uniref:ABC transporter permease n=1 Tax=Anaeropeptidivorans aminofermentans TaxID=2934315 RepID=UPI0020258335|nr:ABC transporter permease [Anaeropeptidivorans aminofermentans]MBE6012573.1 ABC transporter permease [Lachnospiraceae bacterium]